MLRHDTIIAQYAVEYRNTPRSQWPVLQLAHPIKALSMLAVDDVMPIVPHGHNLGMLSYATRVARNIYHRRGLIYDDTLAQEIMMVILDRMPKTDYTESDKAIWAYLVQWSITIASCPYIGLKDRGIVTLDIIDVPAVPPAAMPEPEYTGDDLADRIILLAIDQPDYIRQAIPAKRPNAVIGAIMRYLIGVEGIPTRQAYKALAVVKQVYGVA